MLQPSDIPEFVLASGSPRRRQLLTEAGYRFEVRPSGILEPPPDGFLNAAAYATHLAWLKATDVAPKTRKWVLAADTVTVCGTRILGKPVDREDARQILQQLHGTKHQVVTGVCLWLPTHETALVAADVSTVEMKLLTEPELIDYLDSGDWAGKAGAYGIQDNDPFVRAVDGSVSNIMGLPMELLARLFSMAVQRR